MVRFGEHAGRCNMERGREGRLRASAGHKTRYN